MSTQLISHVIRIEEAFGLDTFSLDGEVMVHLGYSQALFKDCDCTTILRRMGVFTIMDGTWCIRRDQQPDEDATDIESPEPESLEISEKKFQEWLKRYNIPRSVFEQHYSQILAE
jgi:hypothetical protein